MDLNDKVPSHLAKNADPLFIECLLNMPSEMFSDADKMKVQTITTGVVQGGMFGKPASRKEDNLIIQEIDLNENLDQERLTVSLTQSI